jgi:hypothetical protein
VGGPHRAAFEEFPKMANHEKDQETPHMLLHRWRWRLTCKVFPQGKEGGTYAEEMK